MEAPASEPFLAHTSAEKLPSRPRQAPDLHDSRRIYVTRLVSRILSTAICVVIIGLLVDVIRTYQSTKHVTNKWANNNTRFEVWPASLDLRNTYSLLGSAVVAGAISLLLCLASCVGRVRHMTNFGNNLTIFVSSFSLTLWIIVTVRYGMWSKDGTRFDLQSWTCKHSDFEYEEIDFSELCTQLRVGYWGAVGLAGLEVANLLLFVGWVIASRRFKGYNRVKR